MEWNLLYVLRAGLLSGNDLAQRQQMRRIQPVLTHEPLRVLTGFCDVGDVKTGSIGGQQGILRRQLGDLPPEFLFGIQFLYNTLHHQRRIRKIRFLRGHFDSGQQSFGFLLAQDLFLDERLLVQFNQILCPLQPGGTTVIEYRIPSGLCIHLRQRGTHSPGPCQNDLVLHFLSSPFLHHWPTARRKTASDRAASTGKFRVSASTLALPSYPRARSFVRILVRSSRSAGPGYSRAYAGAQ